VQHSTIRNHNKYLVHCVENILKLWQALTLPLASQCMQPLQGRQPKGLSSKEDETLILAQDFFSSLLFSSLSFFIFIFGLGNAPLGRYY